MVLFHLGNVSEVPFLQKNLAMLRSAFLVTPGEIALLENATGNLD